MDIRKEVPMFIEAVRKNGQVVSIEVEVPWMPEKCKDCKGIGHSTKSYSRKVKPVTKVWRPKKKDEVFTGIEEDMVETVVDHINLAICDNKVMVSNMGTKDDANIVMDSTGANKGQKSFENRLDIILENDSIVNVIDALELTDQPKQQREAVKKFADLMNTIKPKSNETRVKENNSAKIVDKHLRHWSFINNYTEAINAIISHKAWLLAEDFNVLLNPEDCSKMDVDDMVSANIQEFRDCVESLFGAKNEELKFCSIEFLRAIVPKVQAADMAIALIKEMTEEEIKQALFSIDGDKASRPESKLCIQIGQGTYSSVYKARDLETGKIVAMKKVRFVNMDPESVCFMAREIIILRKLDHPNVVKLESLVTSRMSCSLYLIFECMEHDLAGLAATPGIKFTEPQADQNQPLTSRVVTLWYRAPELLLGATEYEVAIDLWSSGCILAELFAGKPIMPGRIEVEQMHKIFKLCGSPSEEYWQKTKLPHATSFKPQQPYKRCVAETFKNSPIQPYPFPCDPSNLPKYPPNKELDAKHCDKEARRKRAEAVKGRGPESVRRGSRNSKGVQTPEFIAEGQSKTSTSHEYDNLDDGASGFRIDPHKVTS
ncbi:hypothetical protein PTKIN_Ptkin13bG0021600 [Pterospermum kingtungense]